MKTILVETGVDHQSSIDTKGIQPDLVVRDLPELVSIWKEQLG
jgi:ribonucleotide monophosphatase NagD (HAD superfamily)